MVIISEVMRCAETVEREQGSPNEALIWRMCSFQENKVTETSPLYVRMTSLVYSMYYDFLIAPETSRHFVGIVSI